MNLRQKQTMFVINVIQLLEFIFSKGYSVTFGETYRTPEQAKLNAKKGIGIVDSLHCKRLAIDLNLFDPDGNFLTKSSDHEPFGLYWQSLHPDNRWGGLWKKNPDGNHYQMNDD
jgi:hypothetical protein